MRVYDDIRTADEILLDMITPLDPAALPADLVHVWQMRAGPDLTSGSDIVGGKHLEVSTNVYGLELNLTEVEYAYATNYGGFSSDKLTVEVTFSHGALATSQVVPLLSYGNSTADDAFTVVVENHAVNGYELSLYLNDFKWTLPQEQAVADMFDGGIHHFVLVWDSTRGEANVYIDGVWAGGSDDFDTGAIGDGGTFLLGERIEDYGTGDYQTAGEEFIGTIYEVRVYDDVRTQEQILIDMVSVLDADNLPDGLVNGWQFLGDGIAVSGTDIKGSNDLTIVPV